MNPALERRGARPPRALLDVPRVQLFGCPDLPARTELFGAFDVFRGARPEMRDAPEVGALPISTSFLRLKKPNGEFPAGRRRWRSEDFAQDQVGGEKSDEPQHAQPQDDIKVLVDPGLRLPVVETVKIINVDGEIGVGQLGASGRSKKVADEHQSCGQAGPSRQSPFIIAQPEQEPDEQQWQPAMKKRKPAGEERKLGLEHVAGQAQKVNAQKVAAEVHEPEALRKQNAHGAHADEPGAFQPHARHRENEGGITEP